MIPWTTFSCGELCFIPTYRWVTGLFPVSLCKDCMTRLLQLVSKVMLNCMFLLNLISGELFYSMQRISFKIVFCELFYSVQRLYCSRLNFGYRLTILLPQASIYIDSTRKLGGNQKGKIERVETLQLEVNMCRIE